MSRRVIFDRAIEKLPTFFYPYELRSGLRADTLAEAYYKNWEYEWMIYMMNGIVDPYYGWYLDYTDFNNYLIDKYGSIEYTQDRTIFYRLKWADDDILITPEYFENTVPEVLKKYYSPVFGEGSRVVFYKKRQEDWTVNTNKLIQIYVNTVGSLTKEELLLIKDTGNNTVGEAEVELVDSTNNYIMVKHVTGLDATYLDPGNTILGRSSGTSSTIVSHKVLVNNIEDSEYDYWGPVTIYDYENEKNEANKFIRLLDAKYSFDASEYTRQLLKVVE